MDIKELSTVLKIIGDETRLRILSLLSGREMAVSDICTSLGLKQSAVSKHLVKLRLVGLVRDVRDGSFIYYSLNADKQEYVRIAELLISTIDDCEVKDGDIQRLQDISQE